MISLTKEQVEQLPELLAKATKGPWGANPVTNGVTIYRKYPHYKRLLVTGPPTKKCPLEEVVANGMLAALAPAMAATIIELAHREKGNG